MSFAAQTALLEWQILAVAPILAVVTIFDAIMPLSSWCAKRLHVRRYYDLPILAVNAAFFLILTIWLLVSFAGIRLAELESRGMFDLVQYARIEEGRIVPFTEAELEQVIAETTPDLSDLESRLSFAGEPVKMVIGTLEFLVILLSVAVMTSLARRHRRPIGIWLPLALMANAGAVVWLAVRGPNLAGEPAAIASRAQGRA